MATIERDYGTLGGVGYTGTSNSVHYSLVYLATHDGELRLSYMKRSFISFTFGGKHIEDFNLIATFNDTGFDLTAYADFEDIVTENLVVDGEMYWDTHIGRRTLSFELATDGITQALLDEFKRWFRPGKVRELILAEHPNRMALARVASAPLLLLMPFEKLVDVVLGGHSYTTSTTEYKGTISLELAMAEPFWKSLINIFGEPDMENGLPVYRDIWTDANGAKVDVYSSKDALKIAVEDGIPLSNMIVDTMHFGNNVIADKNSGTGACTRPDSSDEGYEDSLSLWDAEKEEYVPIDEYTEGTSEYHNYWRYRIAKVENNVYICGALIDGAYITTVDLLNYSLNPGDALYFYYCGTAKSYPILTFTFTPLLDNNYYICNIKNKFIESNPPYNTITLKSTKEVKFKFTTPGVYTAYNLAIYIFSNLSESDDWETVRNRIRELVKHYHVRAWANTIINAAENIENNSPFDAANLRENMSRFLLNESNELLPATFSFDGKKGEALGLFRYHINGTDTIPEERNPIEEQIGDMVKSPYLVLTDRNYPKDGDIILWSAEQPQNSYKLTHDVEGGLRNVSLNYTNMYW